MKTLRIDVTGECYQSGVNAVAEILCGGGIAAVPTETVYGLAASAFCDSAIRAVFAAKGRPQDNPLIVHISSIEMLKDIAEDIPQSAILCAERFWPGPFTMVLKSKGTVAKSVSAGLDTVAVRCPKSKICRDIIEKSGLPLAAPSANTSGAPSPTTFAHVLDDLDGKIDAVVCGEACEVGVESTVLSLVGEHPRLLRPGAVTAEQLLELFPDLIVDSAVLSEPEEGKTVASPGMKYKHYAPKTETFLVVGDSDSFTEFVNKNGGAAICFSEEAERIIGKKLAYGTASDEATLARNVFSVLRKADGLSVDKIYIHSPSKSGVGLAVYNRLIRSAGFKVIEL